MKKSEFDITKLVKKGRTKIVVEFMAMLFIGVAVIGFSMWVIGSLVAWETSMGEWSEAWRTGIVVIWVVLSLFILIILLYNTNSEFQGLREVKNEEGYKDWCSQYHYKE